VPDERPPVRLIPAQIGPEDEQQAYTRRIPWRWIITGTIAFLVLSTGYWFKEREKAEALRAGILDVHCRQLSQVSASYLKLRKDLEDRIIQAAESKPDEFVDPRLNLSGLNAGRGLYLLLPIGRALSKDGIAQAALEPSGDAIARCLGLGPRPAKDLWVKGAFLLPEWVAEARKSSQVMRLRVIDDELAQHMRKDLPEVMNLLRPDWFLLVIQLGKTRLDAPVDVYLWDLRSKQKLLSARIQADGMLVPVRFAARGAPPPLKLTPESLRGAGAGDCSIAAQIKAMTGREVASFESVIQPPKPEATSRPHK
jgi:hypothetical protein